MHIIGTKLAVYSLQSETAQWLGGTMSFEEKLARYRRIMKYASWRYSIPGILEQDDLFQEASIILLDVFIRYEGKGEGEFRKLFKTELWHGLWKVLRKAKTKKRGFKKTVYLSDDGIEDTVGVAIKNESMQLSTSPETAALLAEESQAVESAIEKLFHSLDSDAVDVLEQLLDPIPWDAVPKEFRISGSQTTYSRTPTKTPKRIIADLLGMTQKEMKGAHARVLSEFASIREECFPY